MTDRELMQQALDALEKHVLEYETAEALRARLAQPEREWKGLTKEEARELCVANVPYVVDMVAALEARLKEKNT
jgi:hypothetical protein